MDKLKQVLKYQFWILLGLAVIFPLVGWFLASSGLAKGYEEREKKLNARFTELKASPADPNGDWESNLKKLNDVQQLELAKAWVSLWEPQQELKVWPEKLSTTDPENFTSADKGYYRKNYLALREAVFKQIQPLVEDEEDGKRKGRVAISLDTFPISEALGGPRVDNPSSQEIEEAHEDLWLCSALIQVVNVLNRDSSSQLDAIIPEISVFELRGGAKGGASAPKKAAAPTGATQGMMGMSPEAMMNMAKEQQKALGIGKMGPNGGGNALAGGGEGTTVGVIPTVAFNPNDEFGDQGDNPKQRYIENKDEWKTRGFYLEMKINQSRVPELLVELSNCAWPIRITRVHIADVREEELIAADGGAMPSSGGTGMPGMPGMPGMTGGMPGMPAGGMANMADMAKKQAAAGAMMGAPSVGGITPGKAAGGGATAKSTPLGGAASGLPGADLAGGATDGGSKVDPLANPNLVSLAIDGWFTIYKKPKPEVLARVYPPASSNPGSTAPADTGVTAQNGAGADGNPPTAAGTAAGGASPNPADSTTLPADTSTETVADGSESNSTETPPAAETTLATPADNSTPAAGEAPPEPAGDTPSETPPPGTPPVPTDSAAPK